MGSVGLAVTQSNMLTSMLQHGARMLVEFLAQLTSVERVLEYTKIETETNLFEGSEYIPYLDYTSTLQFSLQTLNRDNGTS